MITYKNVIREMGLSNNDDVNMQCTVITNWMWGVDRKINHDAWSLFGSIWLAK